MAQIAPTAVILTFWLGLALTGCTSGQRIAPSPAATTGSSAISGTGTPSAPASKASSSVLAATRGIRVVYAITGYGGSVSQAETVMTDGHGKVRIVFSPGSYLWLVVSDGHRVVDSNQGDRVESADPREARVYITPANLAKLCPRPRLSGTKTVLGYAGADYRCGHGVARGEVVIDKRTRLPLEIRIAGFRQIATKIDYNALIPDSMFVVPKMIPLTSAEPSVRGDVVSAAVAIEDCTVQNHGTYPPSVTLTTGTSTTLRCGTKTQELRRTDTGTTLQYTQRDDSYVITGHASDGHVATYDRATGELTESS
jgi:hypothetical protein